MEKKLIAKGTTTDLNSYTFNGIKDEPIIVITEDGFKYKGELIEDKGEIYKLFKNYLTSCQTEKMYSEEEVFNICREFAVFVQQKRPSYKKQLEWFKQFKNK